MLDLTLLHCFPLTFEESELDTDERFVQQDAAGTAETLKQHVLSMSLIQINRTLLLDGSKSETS